MINTKIHTATVSQTVKIQVVALDSCEMIDLKNDFLLSVGTSFFSLKK